jgi:hypothetical protein
MEPYSFDFFSGANVSGVIWGVGIILAGIVIGSLPFFKLGLKDVLAWTTFTVFLLAGGLVGWGVGRDIIADNENEARLDNLVTQTNELYGVTLDKNQAAALNPPLSRPIAGYEEFGRTSVDFMDSSIPVILVWNEGKLFYAVEGTSNSLPTKEQMAEQTPAPSETGAPSTEEPAPSTAE